MIYELQSKYRYIMQIFKEQYFLDINTYTTATTTYTTSTGSFKDLL